MFLWNFCRKSEYFLWKQQRCFCRKTSQISFSSLHTFPISGSHKKCCWRWCSMQNHICAQSNVYPAYISYGLHKNKSKAQYIQFSHVILTMNTGPVEFVVASEKKNNWKWPLITIIWLIYIEFTLNLHWKHWGKYICQVIHIVISEGGQIRIEIWLVVRMFIRFWCQMPLTDALRIVTRLSK